MFTAGRAAVSALGRSVSGKETHEQFPIYHSFGKPMFQLAEVALLVCDSFLLSLALLIDQSGRNTHGRNGHQSKREKACLSSGLKINYTTASFRFGLENKPYTPPPQHREKVAYLVFPYCGMPRQSHLPYLFSIYRAVFTWYQNPGASSTFSRRPSSNSHRRGSLTGNASPSFADARGRERECTCIFA